MSPKLSKTPEEIPPFFIKKISNSILPVLKDIFNLSLRQGILPKQWKMAYVNPIHKRGSKNNPKNYRPISLTSSFCRILESIIKNKLLSYLYANNLIGKNQHGFLPKRSTASQLLMTLNKWTESYENKEGVNVIYTDFAKAFDKVSHKKLIQVLYSFGISGHLLEWIHNFITNRNHKVYINSVFSEKLPVNSGVPQGSVLGPLLFLLYIEDIQNICTDKCDAVMFADDCKFFSTDKLALQATLKELEQFCAHRQISLCENKCLHLPISRTSATTSFTFGNSIIKKVNEVKDLGVVITSDLQWERQISSIKGKAMQRCHQILKTFNTNNIWTLIKAFTVYVRPILEYNSSIWNPYKIKDKQSIEQVQRFFTRRACRRCKISYTSYEDRLNKLGMDKLSVRRQTTDLITTYKILNEIIDVPTIDMFKYRTTPFFLRGHNFTLEYPKKKNKVSRNFLSHRVIKPWNALPANIVNSTTPEEFKMKLKVYSLKKFII